MSVIVSVISFLLSIKPLLKVAAELFLRNPKSLESIVLLVSTVIETLTIVVQLINCVLKMLLSAISGQKRPMETATQ